MELREIMTCDVEVVSSEASLQEGSKQNEISRRRFDTCL